MKKTTYLIIGIIIMFILIFGVLAYVFTREIRQGTTENNETNGNENDTGDETNSCAGLGCREDDVYVGSVNSDKYYECSCRYAKNINPENIVCFKNDEEALADNRTKSEC